MGDYKISFKHGAGPWMHTYTDDYKTAMSVADCLSARNEQVTVRRRGDPESSPVWEYDNR